MHILGATGEGKSKFLELLLRQNIDNGYGCCLIDPSDNGDTCYKVLKYAIKKGYDKVVLIDPHDIKLSDADSKVPCINPLHYEAPAAVVSGNLMDAIRVLWGQKDAYETPRIQKYLPAVISALHDGQWCLPDAECLMDKLDPVFSNQRRRILYGQEFMKYHHRHHAHLVSAFNNVREWDGYLPTINRLEPLMDSTMKLILGSRKGINFKKLIREKYVVLVNLDPEGVWGAGSPEQRLLGTLIINEITYAISRLRNAGWKGVYYLYIDEAGDYATSKLSYILDKKRKSGLRLTLSHQRFDQFSDKDVSSAVYGGTKIKVLFNTPSRDDRDKMIRMLGFGGELSDREVSYHIQDTAQRNCWIKNNKQKPVKARIKDLPDINIKQSVLTDFKNKIYASEFYKSVGQIREETQKRFDQTTTSGARANALGSQHQVRPQRPSTNAPESGLQDRPDNQTPDVQDAPLERGRENRKRRTPVKRTKGLSPSVIPEHPRDDEPMGR